MSALHFHSISATYNYVKCPCNNFIKRHFNQYFVNNNNNNNLYIRHLFLKRSDIHSESTRLSCHVTAAPYICKAKSCGAGYFNCGLLSDPSVCV